MYRFPHPGWYVTEQWRARAATATSAPEKGTPAPVGGVRRVGCGELCSAPARPLLAVRASLTFPDLPSARSAARAVAEAPRGAVGLAPAPGGTRGPRCITGGSRGALAQGWSVPPRPGHRVTPLPLSETAGVGPGLPALRLLFEPHRPGSGLSVGWMSGRGSWGALQCRCPECSCPSGPSCGWGPRWPCSVGTSVGLSWAAGGCPRWQERLSVSGQLRRSRLGGFLLGQTGRAGAVLGVPAGVHTHLGAVVCAPGCCQAGPPVWEGHLDPHYTVV